MPALGPCLLLWTLLFCALTSGEAQAEERGRATSRYQLYSDDDATSVSTLTLDAEARASEELELGAHVLLDAISSASVDVVSAATTRWTENRLEAGARASGSVGKNELGASYTRSQEEDWSSHQVQVGAGREFFQRNFRVEASYGLVLNRVGRASDPVFERALRGHQLHLGLSQLWDRKTRVGLSYGLQRLVGYQASPYRYVQLDGFGVPEVLPERRMRHALQSYLLRSLLDALTGRLSYRFYIDDWGIRSHTAELRLRYDIGPSLFGELSGRFYRQNAAEVFGTRPMRKYRTLDRELASFWDLGTSARMGGRLGPLEMDASIGAVHYDFHQVPGLEKRLAIIASAGASLPW